MEKSKKKPSMQETALKTRIQLETLRDKYRDMLSIQRRIVNSSNTTQYEKTRAEEKIRSGICSYTIVSEALRSLDEITSDVELVNSLKTMNSSLRAVNKLGKKASPGIIQKKTLNWQVYKLKKQEDKVKPDQIFSEASLGNVDEWLHSKWDSVARSYITGTDLNECLRNSRDLIQSEPVPDFAAYQEALGAQESEEEVTDVSADLKELLDSNIFSR